MKTSHTLETPEWHAPLLGSLWARLCDLCKVVKIQRRERRLRLSESLPFGEKRLVAVVEFDEQRFLIAVTPQNISLLQSLGPAPVAEERPTERV
jgi:flagellar biogenesis protein FliO